ncbi:hypothetical protein HC891_19010 [Candidatus Gracilibacteria bacterium]|nr:hypothetical protein [Candidatus Gracilibacteria bacterium]
MATQTIIWTALPNGISGTGANRVLKLSVFVSPRLKAAASEGDRLSLFADLLDWPARLQGASFKLQFTNGPTVDATFDKSKLDSALWKALFTPESFVRPFVFDNFQGRTLISYPAKLLHQSVKQSYQTTVTRDPEGWSVIDEGGVRGLDAWAVEWNAAAEAAALANLGKPNPTGTELTARALLFHRRPAEPSVQLPADPKDHERTLDVHEAFTALSSYPELMRRLGLVIDLTVPASAVPLSVPAAVPPTTSHVALLPTVPPAPGGTLTRVNRSPRTACVVSANGFIARPIGADFADGLLLLNDVNYDLVPVDIDGAALKLVNTVSSLNRPTELTTFGEGPPVLRSAGITLARTNEASRTTAAFGRAQANNTAVEAGQDVQLFADDLVTGLRIDVFDETKKAWRSLNQRVGTYRFERANLTPDDHRRRLCGAGAERGGGGPQRRR